jgi:glutaminase
MDYASILLEIQEESNAFPIKECDNDYTQLAKVSPNKFGIHLTIDRDDFGVGDSDENFLTKYFKALTVALAFSFGMKEYGKRVGVEPLVLLFFDSTRT